MDAKQLAEMIRNIPDFPKPGIQFKDITTLLNNGPAFTAVTKHFAERYAGRGVDVVVGIEARGFIFGGAAANALNAGFVPVRKPGKLPSKTRKVTYELEYGTDSLEIHEDAFPRGSKVVILDDVLATGGTVAAVCRMVRDLGAEIVECAFVIELDFLAGRKKLGEVPIHSLIHF